MKFGVRGQLTDVMTCVKLLVDRFMGYGVLIPPKLRFPIDLLRRLTTVSHCRATLWLLTIWWRCGCSYGSYCCCCYYCCGGLLLASYMVQRASDELAVSWLSGFRPCRHTLTELIIVIRWLCHSWVRFPRSISSVSSPRAHSVRYVTCATIHGVPQGFL